MVDVVDQRRQQQPAVFVQRIGRNEGGQQPAGEGPIFGGEGGLGLGKAIAAGGDGKAAKRVAHG
jgi:hypothetical protein